MLVATSASARTLLGTLGDAQERVGIRPSAALTSMSQAIATEVTTELSIPGSAISATAGSAIDSSMGVLGPIFIPHAQTLGAGRLNVNAIAQHLNLDTTLGPGAGLTILRSTPTTNPLAPPLLACRLEYDLRLRIASVALAATYGLTDQLDASVVLPIVTSSLDTTVRLDVLRKSSAGQFIPAHVPSVMHAATPVDSTGVGDLVVRLKYGLTVPEPLKAALSLEGQFPTGAFEQMQGTGDYWITPTLDFALPLFGDVAELAARAAFDIDLSQPERTEALYSLGASAIVIPDHLALVAEFLGRSQLQAVLGANETAILNLVAGQLRELPALGFDVGRHDYFDFAFGVRVPLGHDLMAFASGLVALNSAGVRPAGVTPTIGVGGTF